MTVNFVKGDRCRIRKGFSVTEKYIGGGSTNTAIPAGSEGSVISVDTWEVLVEWDHLHRVIAVRGEHINDLEKAETFLDPFA